MIRFPPAKINLGLNVVRRRPDGFHELESVMWPIPWTDVLEAVIDPQLGTGQVVYTRSGLAVPGAAEADLCWKAAMRYQQERALPGVRMHLHKAVPMGAGLGGGSSDAAHVLRLFNALCPDPLPHERLHALAAELGSDCAFFLHDGPQLARGRGEELRPIDIDLKGHHLVVAMPPVHVSTAEVFRHCTPTGRSIDLPAIVRSKPPREWGDQVPNTLEAHVLQAHPLVAQAKERLLQAGAVFAAMSGSGAAVFGLFEEAPPAIPWPPDHTVRVFAL